MGCCSGKELEPGFGMQQISLSEEESIITMREKQIPFSRIKLEDLQKALKTNENNRVLSIVQLRKAMSGLGFDTQIFGQPDENIQNFLKLLSNSSRLYELKTISLFGVVLSIGSPKEKSLILFKLYENTEGEGLSKSEINAMIEDIIDVSVNKLPQIAINDDDDPEQFTLPKEKLLNYVSSLLEKKENYITIAVNSLIADKEKIFVNEFVNKITDDPMLECLLWSYQLRLALNN